MADIEIAARQRFYFGQFEGEDAAVITGILPAYDHTEPLFSKTAAPTEFCVLAYDDELNEQPYETGFAKSVTALLAYLEIEQMLLVQDLCHDWSDFGFNTKKAQLQFNKLVVDTGKTAYLLDHASLSALLPLLFYNNPDKGDCSFYTLTAGFQLGFLYWKGNLHTFFYEADLPKLAAAAKHAGLLIVSRALSQNYRFGKNLNG